MTVPVERSTDTTSSAPLPQAGAAVPLDPVDAAGPPATGRRPDVAAALKAAAGQRWGSSFDPDELALLELRMWKAYYRRQPLRLFGLLIMAEREQAGASWPRALAASVFLTRAAVGFARSTGDYERFAPDIVRGYRMLGLPSSVDVEAVARHELRWWTIRRELGLSSGEAAGESIGRLYAALYGLPFDRVAEAGRLRGVAAEVRDRGATADPDGPNGPGRAYWPEVARLLRESYRELKRALES